MRAASVAPSVLVAFIALFLVSPGESSASGLGALIFGSKPTPPRSFVLTFLGLNDLVGDFFHPPANQLSIFIENPISTLGALATKAVQGVQNFAICSFQKFRFQVQVVYDHVTWILRAIWELIKTIPTFDSSAILAKANTVVTIIQAFVQYLSDANTLMRLTVLLASLVDLLASGGNFITVVLKIIAALIQVASLLPGIVQCAEEALSGCGSLGLAVDTAAKVQQITADLKALRVR